MVKKSRDCTRDFMFRHTGTFRAGKLIHKLRSRIKNHRNHRSAGTVAVVGFNRLQQLIRTIDNRTNIVHPGYYVKRQPCTATNGNFALGSERFQKEVEVMLGRRARRGQAGRPGKVEVVSETQGELM